MQRCPYIHEMKERLLGPVQPVEMVPLEQLDSGREVLEVCQDPQVGTIVKVSPHSDSDDTIPRGYLKASYMALAVFSDDLSEPSSSPSLYTPHSLQVFILTIYPK